MTRDEVARYIKAACAGRGIRYTRVDRDTLRLRRDGRECLINLPAARESLMSFDAIVRVALCKLGVTQ
jgi:hypothetical protein